MVKDADVECLARAIVEQNVVLAHMIQRMDEMQEQIDAVQARSKGEW